MSMRGVTYLTLLLVICGGLASYPTLSTRAFASELNPQDNLVAYIENLADENELLKEVIIRLEAQIEALRTELENLYVRLGQPMVTWIVENDQSSLRFVAPPFQKIDSPVEFESISIYDAELVFDFGYKQWRLSLDALDMVAFWGTPIGLVKTLKDVAQETHGPCTVVINEQTFQADNVVILTNRLVVIEVGEQVILYPQNSIYIFRIL